MLRVAVALVCLLAVHAADNEGSTSSSGSDIDDGFDDLDGVPAWEWGGVPDDDDDDDERHSAASQYGRPPEHEVTREELTAACQAGMTAAEIEEELNLSVWQIKRLKQKWGLHGVAEAARSNMPSLTSLEAAWADEPRLSVSSIWC